MSLIPFFAANWKMNKKVGEIQPFIEGLVSQTPLPMKNGMVVVAPQAPHLSVFASEVKSMGVSAFEVSAQNCGPAGSGPFTGENAPSVLKDSGVEWVILGHSERRHVFKEDDDLIGKRLGAAIEGKLSLIFCIGETLAERKQGATRAVVEKQLAVLKPFKDKLASGIVRWVVAYEPVWAIGTGENATPAQAAEVHGWISDWVRRELSQSPPILYGGSVKADNASVLMEQPHVDGLLVGGASLEAASFAAIIRNGFQGFLRKAGR